MEFIAFRTIRVGFLPFSSRADVAPWFGGGLETLHPLQRVTAEGDEGANVRRGMSGQMCEMDFVFVEVACLRLEVCAYILT